MSQAAEMQICLGSSCFSRGNRDLVMFIRDYLKKHHLEDRIIFRGARCMGHCNNGPNLTINGKLFENVALAEIENILDSEFRNLK